MPTPIVITDAGGGAAGNNITSNSTFPSGDPEVMLNFDLVCYVLSGVNMAIFVLFVARHCFNVKNLQFQCDYVRLSYLIPILTLISLVGLFTKGINDNALEILVNFFEGIVLLNFFNIIVGVGALKADVKSVIMSHTLEVPYIHYIIDLKKYFGTSNKAFRFLFLTIAQFIIFKPLLATIELLCYRYGPTATFQTVAHIINKCFGTIVNIVSVSAILVLICLLEKGHGFNPNFKPLKKFLSLKAFFVLLVLNDLMIVPALIKFGSPTVSCASQLPPAPPTPVDGFKLSPTQRFENICESRFIHLIVLLQTLLFSLFLSYYFSWRDFEEQTLNLAISEVTTGYGSIKCKCCTIKHPPSLLVLYSFTFRDVFFKYLYYVPIPMAKTISHRFSIAKRMSSGPNSPDKIGHTKRLSLMEDRGSEADVNGIDTLNPVGIRS